MGNAALTATRDNFVPICTEYVHEMWVKAKILVRGVRQMSNEIPDIWKVAVRRFSGVQSMPSCLSKSRKSMSRHSRDGSRLH